MIADDTVDANPQTSFQRFEEKFRLSQQEGLALYNELSTKTTVDEFIPGQTTSTITTLYCDGAELPFFRAAKSGGVRNRIRIRLYGDLQTASDSFAWIEWKLSPPRGEKGYTTKQRFRIPRSHLASFFTTPFTTEEIRSFQKNKKNADEAVDCYQRLRRFTDEFALRPMVASHYHRRALLLAGGPDRATFDFALGYSLVSWEDNSLVLTNTFEDSAVILELKSASPLTGWLQELARSLPSAVGFSKFERALERCWLSLANHETIQNADRL
jgi:hypothetical protein